MRRVFALAFLSIIFVSVGAQPRANENKPADASKPAAYAGSSSCRECHEKFYQLWSTSMHGLAMQAWTPEFARGALTPQGSVVTIKTIDYRVDIDAGVVTETGPKGTKGYTITQVLGGKNVFYFLTPLDKGRLQTLPVAYDVNKKEWFDTAASGMRHFPGGETSQRVDWKDAAYTFNTACYSCHVSQLSTNYDPATDTYHTTWTEPGINCETCHGPSVEHNAIARATPQGQPLPELRLIRTKTLTKQQRNDLCLSCHAKASPLTLGYKPEERFFDHFDLVTLEDADYYPDGRDLGENYTFTSWSMSPCALSGQIDCIHCHTSSGRYRFKNEQFNNACMPCHEDKVISPAEHTHHRAEGEGSRCISCHMPRTAFARMNRTDHSMLPPAPAATIAYKSPNACNLCHEDKDAQWADQYVRQWRTRDYQAAVLSRASLIEAARKGDWSRLGDMLAYIQGADRSEVFSTSLIRLMGPSADARVAPALLKAMKDPSPLVRAAATEAMAARPSRESMQALLDATGDDYRLVRTRAAAGLAGYPTGQLSGAVKTRVAKANQEYLAFIRARPDQWTSHYNVGNYHLDRGELKEAVAAYRAALKQEPQAVMAMVNTSIAYSRMGQIAEAEKFLAQSLKAAPENAAANFNMGLLQAEKSDLKQAERYLRKAIAADPRMAQAAYNLCVVTAADRLDEAVTWCRKAAELGPQEPKYGYTLAFYLYKKGERDEAARILKAITKKYPEYTDAALLLLEISSAQR